MTPTKPPVRVTVTGAAGQIGYSLLFRIASGAAARPRPAGHPAPARDRPGHAGARRRRHGARRLRVPAARRGRGHLRSSKTAFDGTSWALLVGSIPRKAGMERNDLSPSTGGSSAPRARRSTATPPPTCGCWSSATRATPTASSPGTTRPTSRRPLVRHDPPRPEPRPDPAGPARPAVPVASVTNLAIWGNHSSTQFPDFDNATIDGQARVRGHRRRRVAQGRVHRDGPATRRGDHRGPRGVVGRVGRQCGDRLGATASSSPHARATAYRWRWSPTGSTAPPKASSSGSRFAPRQHVARWWTAPSMHERHLAPTTASAALTNSGEPRGAGRAREVEVGPLRGSLEDYGV